MPPSSGSCPPSVARSAAGLQTQGVSEVPRHVVSRSPSAACRHGAWVAPRGTLFFRGALLIGNGNHG